MKPVMMSVPWKAPRARAARKLGARLIPLHRRAQRPPLHDHRLRARRSTARRPGRLAARGEEFAEQLGGPDLAVAGDQVAHVLRRRTRQLDGVQDAFDVVTVAIERRHVQRRGFGREQRLRDRGVTRAQRVQFAAPGVVLRFGARHQAQQRIGDAATGREHHSQSPGRQCFEDVGDAAKALGVSDRRTAEFVYDPGGGVRRWHGDSRPEGAKKPGKSTGWTASARKRAAPNIWHKSRP